MADYRLKLAAKERGTGGTGPRMPALDCVSQLNWCSPAACNSLIPLRTMMAQTDLTLIETLLCVWSHECWVGANLEGAHLEGADFSGAYGLSLEQLAEVRSDARTLLPEGLARPPHWPPPAPRT
jgi:hypothetical protein